MAEVVQALGRGGQRFAERVLGWNRKTIRKGARESESGQPIPDRFKDRGRKKIEEHIIESFTEFFLFSPLRSTRGNNED